MLTPVGKMFPELSTLSSIVGRLVDAGPRTTLPDESKIEPWQGQKKELDDASKEHSQQTWVQRMLSAVRDPSEFLTRALGYPEGYSK